MSHRSTIIRSGLQILIVASMLLGIVSCSPVVSASHDWETTAGSNLPVARANPDLDATAAPAACPPGETETMVWPVLDVVDPPTVAPGAVVVVSGHGGYIYCSGGLYDESARSFDLTLDGVALDDLGCYVNHCQTTITIPAATMPGPHIIATEGGSQITVQVQPRTLNEVVYLPLLTK